MYRCWERNINMGYWWIIRSPILFAYLVRLSVSCPDILCLVFYYLKISLSLSLAHTLTLNHIFT